MAIFSKFFGSFITTWLVKMQLSIPKISGSVDVKITLVHICSWSIFLFHFRYKDWETKDALLYCLSSEKLKSDLKEVPKVLLNLAITNLEHESSFVKKAAIKFLSKLWQIQPDCWPEFQYLNSSWKCFNSIQGNVWSY